MKPIVLSWSGGKDCTLALSRLRMQAEYDVVALLTTFTIDFDRIAMHGVRRELLERQAEQIGLPIVAVWIDKGADNAKYERAFANGLIEFRDAGVLSVAFGDLFLEDIRAYRERLVSRLDMECVFPLWQTDTRVLADEFVEQGYRARICCVDTRALAASFCGREFDLRFLDDLPAGVDPCGENGEFHTFVYDGPHCAGPVEIRAGDERQDGPFVFRDLLANADV